MLSYLMLSYLMLSYLILSYLIVSYLILSYLILSYLILSYRRGILTLYPWQNECLRQSGVCRDPSRHLLYTAPTSGGKSMVAEIVLLNRLCMDRKEDVDNARSYLAWSCLCLGFVVVVSSCLVSSCLVFSCRVVSCRVLSCLVVPCFVLSCLVLSCLALT